VGAFHGDVGVAVGPPADMAGEIEPHPQLAAAHAAGRGRLLCLASVDPFAHDT